MPVFRVIDTGLREGRRQIAFDQALIEAHRSGEIPDTIRFLRFPPTALVGRHQALSREINLDYCRAHGIGIARRITGGGAIYFDEGQLGWELVFHRASLSFSSLAELTRAICEAAAAGIERLGVEARYRPRNDIEVGGRKLCGTGGFFEGETIFFQGTLLLDTDPAAIAAALRSPLPKLAKRSLDSAAQRVVTLKELLGAAPSLDAVRSALLEGFAQRLGIVPVAGEITQREEALAAKLYEEEIGLDVFVAEIDEPPSGEEVGSASYTGAGGTIEAYVRLEGVRRERIGEALIIGDFFVAPPRLVYDLEARLRGTPAAQAGETIERFFSETRPGLLSVAPADFRQAVEAAIAAAR